MFSRSLGGGGLMFCGWLHFSHGPHIPKVNYQRREEVWQFPLKWRQISFWNVLSRGWPCRAKNGCKFIYVKGHGAKRNRAGSLPYWRGICYPFDSCSSLLAGQMIFLFIFHLVLPHGVGVYIWWNSVLWHFIQLIDPKDLFVHFNRKTESLEMRPLLFSLPWNTDGVRKVFSP